MKASHLLCVCFFAFLFFSRARNSVFSFTCRKQRLICKLMLKQASIFVLVQWMRREQLLSARQFKQFMQFNAWLCHHLHVEDLKLCVSGDTQVGCYLHVKSVGLCTRIIAYHADKKPEKQMQTWSFICIREGDRKWKPEFENTTPEVKSQLVYIHIRMHMHVFMCLHSNEV